MAAIKITPSSGNVFVDLGFDEWEAERFRVRFSLIIAIRKLINIREKGSPHLERRIEIEPPPRNIRIVQKRLLRITVPVEEEPLLDEATVDTVVRKIRARRLS